MVASAHEVAEVVRTRWAELPPTRGFRLDGAVATDDAVDVAFHWRQDPQPYLVRFPHPGFAAEVLGDGFTAEDAAAELAIRLMEELDTGFVHRADRKPVGGAVLLETGPDRFDGWFVSDVPLVHSPATGRRAAEIAEDTGEQVVVLPVVDDVRVPIAGAGGFLAALGLHVDDARRAVEDGSLIAWVQVGRGGIRDRSAGHAVVVRDGPASARIRVEVLDGGAFAPLAAVACRLAVEAGAETLSAARDEAGLAALGFRLVDDRLVARNDEIGPSAR